MSWISVFLSLNLKDFFTKIEEREPSNNQSTLYLSWCLQQNQIMFTDTGQRSSWSLWASKGKWNFYEDLQSPTRAQTRGNREAASILPLIPYIVTPIDVFDNHKKWKLKLQSNAILRCFKELILLLTTRI